MPDPIKVDVWSDIACPWCFIGKRKLEMGVADYEKLNPGAEVEIVFHSFELAPDTPVDFEGSESDFLVKFKGMPEEQVRGMLANLTGVAKEVGLDYDFDALQHTRTVKAHQLLHLAKAHGKQIETEERLMKAYFEEGRHVGRDEDLADLAVDVGLDRDEVLKSLAVDEYLTAVEADQAQAIAYGIQAVPTFVIDGRYGISGAQVPETFVEAFRKITDEKAG
ncbi:MAG: DsbA family oxidoreductase [Solirubrobacterales bacterium]